MVAGNASPKKTIHVQESVSVKSSRKLLESPSRQSVRTAIKLLPLTSQSQSTITERKSSKTKVASIEADEVSKSRKLAQVSDLMTPIGALLVAVALISTAAASVSLCSMTWCELDHWPSFPDTMMTVKSIVSIEAGLIVCGWVALQSLLAIIPVGFVRIGPILSDGSRQKYRCNGLFALVVTSLILFTMYYVKWPVFMVVSDHFIQLFFTCLLFGLAFGIIGHIKSRRLPSKRVSSQAQTGWMLADAIVGRYLNPRLCGVDVKLFFLVHVGILGYMMLTAVSVIEAYMTEKLSTALIVLAVLSSIYSIDYIIFETSLVNTAITMHDSFGILMSTAMMIGSFFDSTMHRYLLNNPRSLTYQEMAAIITLFAVGYFIQRWSSYIKDKFRQTPHHPRFADYHVIPTVSGKSLLASGLWGLCRHPNYFGCVLMTTALSLTCGWTCVLTYVYPAFMLLQFVQRVHADSDACQRKHGTTAWRLYCQRVRSRLVPFVY